MRIILPLLFAMFLTQTLVAQVPRKALIESFSNASCPPCAAQNPTFNSLLLPNKDKIVTLKFQMNWPGFDPMNAQNPNDPTARRQFYNNFNAVPTTRLDGIIPGTTYGGGIGAWTANNAGAPAGYNQAVLNFAAAQETFVKIEVEHEFVEEFSKALVTIKVTNVGTQDIASDNIRLFLSLTENVIDFPIAPGSTSERIFYSVNRLLIPTANGTPVDLKAEIENTFEFEVEIPSYIYDLRQVSFTAFVQDINTKAVHQAEVSQTAAINGLYDITASSRTVRPTGLCDLKATPRVELLNETDDVITEVVIGYRIGNDQFEMQWDGQLAKNQRAEVEAGQIELQAGTSQLTYSIISVNGAKDFNRMNNLLPAETISTFGSSLFGSEMTQDFENTANYADPEGALIIKNSPLHMVVINGSEVNQNRPIGGYGLSDKALLGNCYDMLANVNASFVMQNIDISEKTDYMLKFDYSYASYTGEADRLIIEASTNCGGTWTSLFNRAGATLATAPNNTNFFVPQATQWRSDSISLAQFNGNDELMIRFRVVSAYGNNIWVDNISVDGQGVNTRNTFLSDNSLNIFPNPATTDINMIIELSESAKVDIHLFDIHGKMVATLANGDLLPAGYSNRSFAIQQPAGVYFVHMRTPQGEINKRLVVVK
jgi:hypothetical protein